MGRPTTRVVDDILEIGGARCPLQLFRQQLQEEYQHSRTANAQN
jgi:hypothetical protein